MKRYYNTTIFLYIMQLILLVLLINNNFMKKYDYFQSVNKGTLELFLGAIIFFLNIIAIFVIKNLYVSSREEHEYRISNLKFNHIAEQNRLYRQNRHDLKNHLSIISGLIKEGELQKLDNYLSFYLDDIDMGILKIETGQKEIDILFYLKISQANEKGILVEFICTTVIVSHTKYVVQLVSILGNILDNAIEACENINGDKKKLIKIEVKNDPIDYIFQITNTFEPRQILSSEILFQEGFSTKNCEGRGEGLYIVKKLVNRLNGEININIDEEGVFNISIEIPKYRLEC